MPELKNTGYQNDRSFKNSAPGFIAGCRYNVEAEGHYHFWVWRRDNVMDAAEELQKKNVGAKSFSWDFVPMEGSRD